MLDRDLAKIYGVKPIRLREQVKRNLRRFPESFMFRLNENEANLMVSQNAIPSGSYMGGALPLVFTEFGILMLANVLRSETAIEMSIRIIELFVKWRKEKESYSYQSQINDLKSRLDENEFQIEQLFQVLEKISETNSSGESSNPIGFRFGTEDI